VNTSWRVDETYINIRGEWSYLYLAVDKHAKTVDQQAEQLGSSASAAGASEVEVRSGEE
jgi:putative transposase